jgi:hypothetical protein
MESQWGKLKTATYLASAQHGARLQSQQHHFIHNAMFTLLAQNSSESCFKYC